MFGFLYGRNVSLTNLKVTSWKETLIRFVLISILKPKCLNTWLMLFLNSSVYWSFTFFTTIKPSSLYNPTFWLMSFVRCDNINISTSSHTSTPSWLFIVTSKQDSEFFFHASVLSNSKDFLSSILMLIFVFASTMAASYFSSFLKDKNP